MDTIRQIEKKVKEERKRGYEGYSNLKKYFSQFDSKQIEYIEAEERIGLAESKRWKGIGGFITIGISMFAVLFSALPEQLKNDIDLFLETSGILTAALIIFIVIYIFTETYFRGVADKKNAVLEIIQSIRREKKAKEYEVEIELGEDGTKATYSVAVEKK